MKKYPFAPHKTYEKFCKYFPFATVDIIAFYERNFILTKRNIPPYRGYWHLPGGIIRKGEKIFDAANRVFEKELHMKIELIEMLGVYENNIKTRHDITHCFIGKVKGKITETVLKESNAKLFDVIPNNIIPYHKIMIRDAINSIKY